MLFYCIKCLLKCLSLTQVMLSSRSYSLWKLTLKLSFLLTFLTQLKQEKEELEAQPCLPVDASALSCSSPSIWSQTFLQNRCCEHWEYSGGHRRICHEQWKRCHFGNPAPAACTEQREREITAEWERREWSKAIRGPGTIRCNWTSKTVHCSLLAQLEGQHRGWHFTHYTTISHSLQWLEEVLLVQEGSWRIKPSYLRWTSDHREQI